MEGGISADDMENGEVSYNNCQIDGAEGNRDPAMEIFKTLEARQKESGFLEAAIIKNFHGFTILDFINLQYRIRFLESDRSLT